MEMVKEDITDRDITKLKGKVIRTRVPPIIMILISETTCLRELGSEKYMSNDGI